MEDLNEYSNIIDWIYSGNNKEVIHWVEHEDCHHMALDDYGNNFLHHSAIADNIELLKYFLNWDKKAVFDFQGLEINRIINDRNDSEMTALDLCVSDEAKMSMQEFRAKTGKEMQNEWEKMEDAYYADMAKVVVYRLGHSVSQKMYRAIKDNDLLEFIRLAELDSLKGGLLITRFTTVNINGQNFREYATELKRSEFVAYLDKSK